MRISSHTLIMEEIHPKDNFMTSFFHKFDYKYNLLKLLIFALFVLMLSHPSITCSKASTALVIWFNTLVPTLLPVLIVSNLILITKTWELFIPILHPILGRLFYISPSGSFSITLGVLCGYPIGAKVVSDLYTKKELSYSEAKRILTFVNFPSPMFLNGYLLQQCIFKISSNLSDSTVKPSSLTIQILISIYGSAIIIGIFHSIKARMKDTLYSNHTSYNTQTQKGITKMSLTITTVQQTLLSSAEILLFVGLYMMIATILAGFLEHYLYTPFLPLFAGMLEMTTGISLLTMSNLSVHTCSSIAIFLCCFGGMSIALQTSTVLPKEKGWFWYYLKWKVIHGMTAVLIFQLLS